MLGYTGHLWLTSTKTFKTYPLLTKKTKNNQKNP